MANGKMVFFLVYLILGLYLINFAGNWVVLPTFDPVINNWVMAAIGVLMIIGGIFYLKASNRYPQGRY